MFKPSFTPESIRDELDRLISERDALHAALCIVTGCDTLGEAQDVALTAVRADWRE